MSIRLPPQFLAPRLYPSPCIQEPRRRQSLYPRLDSKHFHATCRVYADSYYETLEVSPSASQAEIKKQFYQLSKTHHPDRNRENAEAASQKFVAISEAYTIIGNAAKREKYDRDLARAQGTASPSASHSSTSPGGRRATGLSKRRANFRGPPPSFYRSGGWGSQSSKRSANAGGDGRSTYAETEAKRQQRTEAQYGQGGGAASGANGTWPFAADAYDVPHFNRHQHYRTQSTVEEQLRRGRIKRRRAWGEAIDEVDETAGAIGRFLMVSGVVALGLGTPALLLWRNISG